MSLGEGAWARLSFQNETTVVYDYLPYSLNISHHTQSDDPYDGRIILPRSYFPDPIISKKRIRRPSGRKVWISKKTYPAISYEDLLRRGLIRIENSACCFALTSEGYDALALKLVYKIGTLYRETGEIPRDLSLNY